MRRSLLLVSLLVLVAAVAQAQSDATILFAELRGSNEVPPTTSSVVGVALITIDSSNLMTVEIDAPGIQNPTAAHIHNNVAGQNAGVFVGFTPALVFSNGRLKGTFQLDASKTGPLLANPAGFYVNVHTSANGGGEIRGQLALATEQDIAIAGNVTTGAGDKFVTDTRIFNPSATAKAVVLVEFFASGVNPNVNSSASKVVELAPRAEAVLDDVTGPNGLNIAGQTGAIRVTSNTGLLVTSNIFNDQRGATPSRGTFGQFVPAVARANALKRGVVLHLSNKTRDVANPSGFRTNIGFFNPNQGAAVVNLTLRTAAGASLATATLVLNGLTQQQTAITSLFPAADLSNAPALTLSFDSTLSILVYGAVNDNISGDSILVPAQPDVAP